MSDARKKMLERIKAILSKTMENGCTEGEAMAALAKARELMATYEIDEKELDSLNIEKTTTFRTEARDPYEIKHGLSVNVGKFTRCKAYYDRDKVINFAGKESDIIFATWLLDTLQRFVMRALREYQKQRAVKGGTHANSNFTSASFVMGCASRINEKLKELCPPDWAKTQELIVKEMKLDLSKSRASRREVHEGSLRAGHTAGNSARFDRPVGQGGRKLLK